MPSRAITRRILSAVTHLLLAMSVFYWAPGVAQTPPITFKFGPLTGEVIDWPAPTDLFTGQTINISRPTVIGVTALSPCNNCEFLIAIASSWVERYSNIDVILLTRRNGDLELLRQELSRDFPALARLNVVADGGDVAEALDINAQPIFYLVSASGEVLFRHTGSEVRRLIAFDEMVKLANNNELEAEGLASESTTIASSQNQIPDEWGLADASGPIVVLLHSDDCITCRRLAENGLAIVLNDFANRYPAVQFLVLREAEPDLGVVLALVQETFGHTARSVLEAGINAQDIRSPSATLIEASLDPRISVVEFEPGSAGDPMLLPFIGTGLVPNIFVFNANGQFIGPKPYWQGKYDAGGLISFLEGTLSQF